MSIGLYARAGAPRPGRGWPGNCTLHRVRVAPGSTFERTFERGIAMKRGRSSVRISALGLWVACGSFFFLLGAFAADPVFLRGDANADGQVSISDAMTILNTPVEELPCAKAADIDDDGSVTLRSMNEPRMLRAFIFSPLMALNTGFPQPRPPFPEPGTDPSSDSLGCSGYVVVPPVVAQGSVRIGEVRGSAGQI